MTDIRPTDTLPTEEAGTTGRLQRSALLMPLASVLAAAAILAAVGAPPLVPLLLGAAGWIVALMLRQPVALLASQRLDRDKAARVVGWVSGPAEELVRLALVLLVLRTVPEAVWAGFGWATIEVVFAIVNALVIARLLTKDDDKSREARELLAAQVMLRPHSPAWALVERISATALHIAFTLLLFVQPWLVLVTLPLHSVTNMLMVRLAARRLALAELAFAAVSVLVLAVALVLAFPV